MTRRVIHWIGNVLRDQETEVPVHFHAGPEAHPAVCFDERCGLPRLDVGTG